MYNTKRVNYNLWVIMTYQCKFRSYNKCISLVGFLITEEATFVWSQEVNGKSLYHLYIFVPLGSEVTQLCLTLCNPMDCSLPHFSVHGIFQARVLEWVDISFPRGSSQPRDRTWVSCIVGRHFTIRAKKSAHKNKNKQTNKSLGLPLWLTGKESTCQCRKHGFDP